MLGSGKLVSLMCSPTGQSPTGALSRFERWEHWLGHCERSLDHNDGIFGGIQKTIAECSKSYRQIISYVYIYMYNMCVYIYRYINSHVSTYWYIFIKTTHPMLLEPMVEFCATPGRHVFFARAFFSESRWARPCRSQLKPEMGRIISGLWSYCNRWKILRLWSSEKNTEVIWFYYHTFMMTPIFKWYIILHHTVIDSSYPRDDETVSSGHFWDGPWKVDQYLMCKKHGPVDGRFSSTKTVPSNGGWWIFDFLLS